MFLDSNKNSYRYSIFIFSFIEIILTFKIVKINIIDRKIAKVEKAKEGVRK